MVLLGILQSTLKKNEKRMYFLEFFGKIEENLNTKTRLRGDGWKKQIDTPMDTHKDKLWIDDERVISLIDDDSEAYLNRLQKKEVQTTVGRYLRSAEKYLDNVCEGKFP